MKGDWFLSVRDRYRRRYGKTNQELRRLHDMPRYTSTTTNLFGTDIGLVDGRSFYYAYDAIFRKGIYTFDSKDEAPLILDCGANIGLATIFWKQRYPNARIVAFEPDPNVFGVLKSNMDVLGFDHVEVRNEGLWGREGYVSFEEEGADAGKILEGGNGHNEKLVKVARLSPYLSRSVDMLKLDIEGAEYDVIKESADHLSGVRNLFVEYHSWYGSKQVLPELLMILRDAGFRIDIQPELNTTRPLTAKRMENTMDMRLNIFGYRLSE